MEKLKGLSMRKENFSKIVSNINELIDVVNFQSEQIKNIKQEIRKLNGEYKN